MPVLEEKKRRWTASLVTLMFGMLLVGGCAVPASLDGQAKRVAVISLVSEEVRVTRVATFAATEAVTLDMEGKLRQTIHQVFASRVATGQPKWTIESLDYDKDLNYGHLRAAAMAGGFSYMEGIRKQIVPIMQAKKLDAVFLVFETAQEGLETRYRGVGAQLIAVPGYLGGVSTVSRLDVHSSLFILGMDEKGDQITHADLTGLIGTKTWDRTKDRYSFETAENLKSPRVEFLRAAVVSSVTEVVSVELKRMGI